MLQWLIENWQEIGIGTAIVSSLGLLIKKLLPSPTVEEVAKELEDAEDRQRIREELEGTLPALARYQEAIGNLNTRLDGWFGANPWGFSAFDKCLVIAIFYPLALMMLG